MTKPRHRVGRATQDAASSTIGTLPSTFLSDPTPLIGRERELEVIQKQLQGSVARLLTLTGPAGIGKTRLALAAAHSLRTAFPDGVWFVDLAPLQDPAGVEGAIKQALEKTWAQSRSERVVTFLKDRHLLLLLDNFEHVLPTATLVSELLAACPQLKVLVTSREPLNLRLEHRLPLSGLAVPDLQRPDPERVAQAASAALFLEHARRVQPDFALTGEAAHALVALLRRLDGIPLAIKIAAAHSNVLSPPAMLARLRGQALLSTEEARDVPARHRTLHEAIEWSYTVLNAEEEAIFRRLAVFVGGWTLDAAEAVIQDEESGSRLWPILAVLVEKSLVQADAAGDGDRRYRMLGPIREYALERLAETGERDATRQRHAAYYLALAERAEVEFSGPQEWVWFRRLEQEHENLLAALRWATDRGEAEISVRLAVALPEFWMVRGYLREGRYWVEEVLSRSAGTPPPLRAKALQAAAMLTLRQGDYVGARGLLQEALALVEAVGDSVGRASALSRLGSVATLQGDAPEAQALFERSLALSREAGDSRGMAYALVHLGRAFLLSGDLERAEAALTEGLEIYRRVDNMRATASTMINLAQLKLKRRDDVAAAALASESLRLARAVDHQRAIQFVAMIAALVGSRRRDIERATRLLAAVDAWSETTGVAVNLAYLDPELYAKLRADARQQMGEPSYSMAVAEGRAMSVDEVVDLTRACLGPLVRNHPDGVAASSPVSHRTVLSGREEAVLRLIAEGLSNKQIATALAIAERTVKAHLTSAMNKLGVDNRAHAAVVALQRGLL